MIRVLHIIATLDRAGAEGQLARLCLGLDRTSFRVSVCCLTRGGPYADELRAAGVEVGVLGKQGRYDWSVLNRLRSVLTERRPHIVHTWLFTSNFWGRLAARLAGVPVIIGSERAVDIWKTSAHRWLDRQLARVSSAVVANADAVAKFCTGEMGIPRWKMRVIRNGLDIERFDSDAQQPPAGLPRRSAALLIGTVARLEEQKGILYLLAAMGTLVRGGTDAELWIAGDGPLRRTLEEVVRSSEVLRPRVRFLGRRTDVPALLRRFDIFVLPSLWEGLPNAVIEAMAAGRPVVATNVDGVPEVVVEGRTGLLVAPRSPDRLAGALAELAREPARCRAMGRAGRERVRAEFTEGRMVAEYEKLYKELAEEARIA